MANILLSLDGIKSGPRMPYEAVDRISAGPQGECWIYGKEGTFCLVRNGADAIASIGYVCHVDGDSVQGTLSEILSSFHESQIGDLKKKLIGQYVLLIKKGQSLYLFSDFMGARNIFYSDDGGIISSSFSQVEDLVQTGPGHLDMYKVLEFLALKHVLYPAWLGRSTKHKRVKWLLPYEYLAIDVVNSSLRLGSVVYSIDNKKQSDRSLLSEELLSTLRAIVGRREFKDSPVAASLSGGRDSRLVAAIAAEYFTKIRYRIAVAAGHFDSLKDMKVAKKLATLVGIPLDVYWFQHGRDEERFRELTEGMSPIYNSKIAAVQDNAKAYSLGFGGVFGSELFMPLPWRSIDQFVESRIEFSKRALKMENRFWKSFRDSLYEQIQSLKVHFELSEKDERDYIRLFILLITARYASFILSGFNCSGNQLEPYGSYGVVDLALRVPSAFWGNHRRLGGDARVQQAAMAKLNRRMARILTYKNYRPMLPLSATSLPVYLAGFTFQGCDWIRRKFDKSLKETTMTALPGGYYISNGWEKGFLYRMAEKYGMPVKFSEKSKASGKS